MRFNQKRKLDKKKAVSLIRRFISGEDIAAEILPISYNLTVLSTDELKKLWTLHEYKEKHGIELIEPGWTFKGADGNTVTYNEYMEIEDKLKDSIGWIPDNGRDRPPTWTDGSPILWNEARPEENKPLIWHEQKTYPDPSIPGNVYTNPETLKDIEEIEPSEPLAASNSDDPAKCRGEVVPTDEAANEPVKGLSGKEKAKLRLEEFERVNELMKARRDKVNEFTQMNSEFSSGWFQ